MDIYQKSLIDALVTTQRYIFYLDTCDSIDEERFEKEFNTKNFSLAKLATVEELIRFFTKLYEGLDKKYQKVGIIVNKLSVLHCEADDKGVATELRNQYMHRQLDRLMSIMKDFALNGTIVYVIGKSEPKKSEE
jgi:hypothetical protein